jgi:hypothetical protein
MMRILLAGLGGLMVLSTARAETLPMNWAHTVATLETERGLAVTCLQTLILEKKCTEMSQVASLYGRGKTKYDSIIASLRILLVEGIKPNDPEDLTKRLRDASKERKQLCGQAAHLPTRTKPPKSPLHLAAAVVPPSALAVQYLPGSTAVGGAVSGLFDSARNVLISVASILYNDWHAEDKIRREAIATSLKATRWPQFTDVVYKLSAAGQCVAELHPTCAPPK